MVMKSIVGRQLQQDTISGRLFSFGRPVSGIDEVGIGNTFYVSSVIAGTDGASPSTACATLALALAKCTANQGDKVVILPGHVESIAAATAITPAGVRIIGLGTGNKRPTFTFTTANTAGFTVAVDNISIENCIFIGNFLSIASLITLSTAAEFSFINNDVRDTDATHGFLSVITTTVSVNSDGLTFNNNRVKSLATTTPGPAIVIANTIDRVTANDNYITHTVASNNISMLIEHGALVVTNLMCAWNFLYSINTDTASGAILVKTSATTGSGIIAHNRVRCLDVAGGLVISAAAVQYGMFDNLYIGDGTQNSGYLLPAIGTDT